jgi:hypothetical protein
VKLIDEMATSPGRYIFALSQVRLINEKMADLEQAAQFAGTNPTLKAIYYGVTGRTSVTRAIEEARLLHENDPHVILLITHEGMMGADLNDFHGWRARIDENPHGVSNGTFKAPASGGVLADIFELEPSSSEWSILKVKENGPTKKSISQDPLAKLLGDMRKCAARPQGALIDVGDWDDLRDSGRSMNWLSFWSPLALAAFDDVVIAAAGYFIGIAYLVAEKLIPGRITYIKNIIAPTVRAHRLFKIHYFAAAHRGSTTFWEKKEGKDCLVAVSQHLETVGLGYWSCNEAIDLAFHGRVKGTKVPPKVEGTNSLIAHRACALIYSSKCLPEDEVLIKLVGLAKDQIERARETEDVLQFIMRGAVRDPPFSGDYDVYLYDQHQADALAEYIRENEIGDVELIPVDEAGIMEVEREVRGQFVEEDQRSKKQRANERRVKNTESRRLKRDQEKQQKIVDGSYRERGRPRKTAGRR